MTQQIAHHCWNDVMNAEPKLEIFVISAIVSEIKLISEEERKNALALKYNFDANPTI